MDSSPSFLEELGIYASHLRCPIFILDLTSETLKLDALKRRSLSPQTMNASVLFTVFVLEVKVVLRQLRRL